MPTKTIAIVEHYTAPPEATDHVFGLCHPLGYGLRPDQDRRTASRKRREPGTCAMLKPLIGDTVETDTILGHGTELVAQAYDRDRRGRSVRHLRKPRADGAGNVARGSPRARPHERTLFTRHWLSDPALRQPAAMPVSQRARKERAAYARYSFTVREK